MSSRRMGHNVLTAPDGVGGLKLLRLHAPDLLITDIMMPGMDGLELLQELLPTQSQFRILVMSGAPARWNLMDLARRLGAHKTLAKPFTHHELLGAVNEVLRAD
jgi:DNA-binding response OmpR family regulator